jgi:hypothetical protein
MAGFSPTHGDPDGVADYIEWSFCPQGPLGIWVFSRRKQFKASRRKVL